MPFKSKTTKTTKTPAPPARSKTKTKSTPGRTPGSQTRTRTPTRTPTPSPKKTTTKKTTTKTKTKTKTKSPKTKTPTPKPKPRIRPITRTNTAPHTLHTPRAKKPTPTHIRSVPTKYYLVDEDVQTLASAKLAPVLQQWLRARNKSSSTHKHFLVSASSIKVVATGKRGVFRVIYTARGPPPMTSEAIDDGLVNDELLVDPDDDGNYPINIDGAQVIIMGIPLGV